MITSLSNTTTMLIVRLLVTCVRLNSSKAQLHFCYGSWWVCFVALKRFSTTVWYNLFPVLCRKEVRELLWSMNTRALVRLTRIWSDDVLSGATGLKRRLLLQWSAMPVPGC